MLKFFGTFNPQKEKKKTKEKKMSTLTVSVMLGLWLCGMVTHLVACVYVWYKNTEILNRIKTLNTINNKNHPPLLLTRNIHSNHHLNPDSSSCQKQKQISNESSKISSEISKISNISKKSKEAQQKEEIPFLSPATRKSSIPSTFTDISLANEELRHRPAEIIDSFLFLGDRFLIYDLAEGDNFYEFTIVINVADNFVSPTFPSFLGVTTYAFPMNDEYDAQFLGFLAEISDIVRRAHNNPDRKERILIHCKHGRNRSVAILAGILFLHGYCKTIPEAFTHIRERVQKDRDNNMISPKFQYLKALHRLEAQYHDRFHFEHSGMISSEASSSGSSGTTSSVKKRKRRKPHRHRRSRSRSPDHDQDDHHNHQDDHHLDRHLDHKHPLYDQRDDHQTLQEKDSQSKQENQNLEKLFIQKSTIDQDELIQAQL